MIGADYIRKQFYFRLRTCTSDSPIYKKKRLDVISGQFDLPPRVSVIQKRREVRSEGKTMSEPIGIRQQIASAFIKFRMAISGLFGKVSGRRSD